MSEITKEIKEIEKREAELAKKKQELISVQKKQKAAKAELEALVKKSGFSSPRKLVDAIIEHYSLRMGGKKTGPKPSAEGRRKRTKITPELRDQVKAEIESLGSVNAASKKLGISYLVVAKIHKGGYDQLK